MAARTLPNITLVTIDSVARNLTKKALEQTYKQIEPAAAIDLAGPYNSIGEVSDFLWYIVPNLIRTSHILTIQYDGYVLDGTLWNDEWLRYDYIGAPWSWHRDGYSVGNGGFSLRSSRLMRYLSHNCDRFPQKFPEDEILCRYYRPKLESLGFKWAPVSVARAFSFEREKPRPTFGFHGIFNLPHVLSLAELTEWKNIAPEYVQNKVEWNELPPTGIPK